jgi:hypothetical protein
MIIMVLCFKSYFLFLSFFVLKMNMLTNLFATVKVENSTGFFVEISLCRNTHRLSLHISLFIWLLMNILLSTKKHFFFDLIVCVDQITMKKRWLWTAKPDLKSTNQDDDSGLREQQEPAGNRWKTEAVLRTRRSRNYQATSGRFLAVLSDLGIIARVRLGRKNR